MQLIARVILTCYSAISYTTLVQSNHHADILSTMQSMLQQHLTQASSGHTYTSASVASFPQQQSGQQHLQASSDHTCSCTLSASSSSATAVNMYCQPSYDCSVHNKIVPTKTTLVRFQSIWLRKAWRVETLRSTGSWTFCMRTWNVLASEAPIFDCIETDDVLGFQQSIASGRYTIDDRTYYGDTLLEVRTN